MPAGILRAVLALWYTRPSKGDFTSPGIRRWLLVKHTMVCDVGLVLILFNRYKSAEQFREFRNPSTGDSAVTAILFYVSMNDLTEMSNSLFIYYNLTFLTSSTNYNDMLWKTERYSCDTHR